jgi:uncharacterized protein
VIVVGLILALAIGVSLGLLGGGGSILTVPVVHYVLGVPAHDAIAMSLVVVGVTSAVALVPHARAGRVRWPIGLVFGAASMSAAFVGGRLGAAIPGAILITAFAGMMIVAGTAMLTRARRAAPPATAATAGALRIEQVLALGLGVGLLTGILGAGGGFVVVPSLILFGGLAMRDAVGTSLLVIAMNSFAGLAGVAAHASIDGRITAAVTAVAAAGSLVGTRAGRRLSATVLQRTFGWFVIAVACSILVAELT